MKRHLIMFICALCAASTNAATIHVPADQPTIQAGIDVAGPDDTVLVAPGAYSVNLDFKGKDVKVVSSGGASVTILQPASNVQSVVRFDSGEGLGAELTGFTIQNSKDFFAMYIENSSPTVKHNVFFHNRDGIISGCDPLTVGGTSAPDIHHNLFNDNGGTANVAISSPARFYNNTIVNSQRAGMYVYHDSAVILNNIVIGCPYYGIIAYATTEVDYNDFYNNNPNYLDVTTPGPNDISSDPVFIDPTFNDFTLHPYSPCIDAGDPDPQYNDPDGTRNDMGAFPQIPDPPFPPQPIYPPDTLGAPVFSMSPTFSWFESTDPDPLDTVRYKLEIATDSGFNFVYTVDSIAYPPFSITDSLQFGTHYWWRVTAFDNTGLSTMSVNTPDFWTWTLGDLNHTHSANIADLVYLVDFLFRSGPAPYPKFVGDVNGDCRVNVADVTCLVDYLFLEGPAPKVGCE